MVKHIVLFKIKDGISPEEKEKVMNEFRQDILSLTQEMDFIRNIEVGFNINGGETWDICLNSSFDSLDDVRNYSVHPKHTEAAGKLKPYLCGRSCVDYDI